MTEKKRIKKLTTEQILKVRQDFTDGWPAQIIAARTALNITTVRKCVTGVTFAGHLGATVEPTRYYKVNKRNLAAYNKVLARLPKGSGHRDVDGHHLQMEVGAAIMETNAKVIERESIACDHCANGIGTIPLRIIAENTQVLDETLCIRCFIKFTKLVAEWM